MSTELTDNEESYWFVRWVQMRRKYKNVLAKLEDNANVNITNLVNENKSLKTILEKVKEDYQPKRIYKGRKK